jgi:hypothetical protein
MTVAVTACGEPVDVGGLTEGVEVHAGDNDGASGGDASIPPTSDDGGLPLITTPPCTGGRCPVLLWSGLTDLTDTGSGYPIVGATNVYWRNGVWDDATQKFDGALMTVPIDGGPASTLDDASAPPPGPVFDAGNGDYFYEVTVAGSGDATKLLRVPVSGGKSTTLATLPYPGTMDAGPPAGGGVTFDAANVYWEDISAYDGQGDIGCGGACLGAAYTMLVLSTPRAGGTVTTLASTKKAAYGPASLGPSVTTSMGVDASYVYFIDDGAIVRVPIAGGAETTVASSPSLVSNFAFDGENFYWPAASGSDGSTGIVAKVAKSGGVVSTFFSVEAGQVLGCAVDSTSVYVFYSLALTTDAGTNTPGAIVKITSK